jgi:peptidoglycan-associated lipoprotein
MKHRCLLALATLLVPFATSALAQTGTWELNMRGGALRHDVFEESATDFTIGAKVARYTAGGWGIGAAIDFADAGERSLPEGGPVDVLLLRYAAEVDRSLPARGKTRFTLGAGVGAATASYDGLPGARDKNETSLMVPLSAGLRFMNRANSPSWGLTLGVRDQMVFLSDTDPLGNARNSDVAHHVQGAVGLSFFFSGGKKVTEGPRSESAPRAIPSPVVDDSAAREARERALASIREKVFFDFDKYELKPPSRETLRRKAEALRALPDIRIVIEGHADERGTVEYNLALGEKRARAARDFLTDLGIDPERMSIVSYGEERPAVFGHDETAWSQNRRDEFVPSGN